MPEVTMSLAELDKLRDDIKERDNIISKKEEEINTLKSKQKEVIITEEIKYIPDPISYDVDVDRIINLMSEAIHARKNIYEVYNPNYAKSIEGKIRNCIRINTRYSHSPIGQKNSYYKNLDDIKLDIRKELELEYSKEIVQLRNKVKSIREEEQEKSLSIQKNKDDQIKQLLERDKEWAKKYSDLEDNKREESVIDKLMEDRNEWRTRYLRLIKKPWYKRIFYN